MGKSAGRCPQSQGNDFRFLTSVEDLSANSTFRLAIHRDLKTLCDKSFSNVLDGFRPTVKRIRNLRVSPLGAIGIGLQQNSSPLNFLGGYMFLLEKTAQQFAFGSRTTYFLGIVQPSLVGRTLT